MRKGSIKEHIGWVTAMIILLFFLAILLIWPNNILVKKILDTINFVIKIIEVGP